MSNQEIHFLIKNKLQYLYHISPNSKFNVRKIYQQFQNIIDKEITFYNNFSKKVYCFINRIDKKQKCLVYDKEVKFREYYYGYNKHCSKKCLNESDYKKDKTKNTMNERYGCDYAMQNTESFVKQQKHTWKKYALPSGIEINVQGYEPFAFDLLFKNGYEETDIIYKSKLQPQIWYYFNNKKRRHYLDIFIPKENRIIEVKSQWTFQREEEKVLTKQKSAIDQGFIYEIWIISPNGELITSMN